MSLVAIWLATNYAANQAYDKILTSKVLQIAGSTWYRNGTVNVDVPIAAISNLSPDDRTFYAVLDTNGRTIAGDINFRPHIPWAAIRNGPVLFNGTYKGVPVRIAIAGRRMPVTSPHPWAIAMLAQTTNARFAFARDLTADTFVVILVMGILTIIAAMFTLFQALSPLKRIEQFLRQRDPLELSPLSLEVPIEIRTLVDTLNGFMRRLAAHQSASRRVMAEAAHQLRTPVTALLSQMELLSNQEDESKKRVHLSRLQTLSRELGALINQLIHHAMVQQRAQTTPLVPTDLAALIRAQMSEALSDGPSREIDVSIGTPDTPCIVDADPTALREAIKNILHNALQYGAPSLLRVELVNRSRYWELRFIDDGPGIPPEAWHQVRKPFSTRSGGRSGASLGLAIAQEVMISHRGRLHFAFREDGLFMVILIFRARH
ncbi:sensor histidine kinase [Pandoraea thiooxydans]|uniref:sensor histidine kinase n=1 Tax=Pandoraea thiooxydans TaxID=445709 RepID=UPI001F2FE739|nr:sensor histidine kinase [Pandoraea thiooxydans]